MKCLVFSFLIVFSTSIFANGKCQVRYNVSPEGKISGMTNSLDLGLSSYYKKFEVNDDDGFITQLIILNKTLEENKNLDKPILTKEDLFLLEKAIDRSVAYSTDPKILNNPRVRDEDKANLKKVAEFGKSFKKKIKANKANVTFNKDDFLEWRTFIEDQKDLHFFTLLGIGEDQVVRGVVNVCGNFPPTSATCCSEKIADRNNILAMSLCSKNFITNSSSPKVFANSRSQCLLGYSITVDNSGLPGLISPGAGASRQ